MKKILLLIITLTLLVGCSSNKTVNEILGKDFKDFVNAHLNESPNKLEYEDAETSIVITDSNTVKKVYNAISNMKIGGKTTVQVNTIDKGYKFSYKNGDTLIFNILGIGGEYFIQNPSDGYLYEIKDTNGLFDIKLK